MNFEPIVVNKSMKQALKLPLIALAMTLLSVGCFFLDPPEYGLLGGAARILDKFGPAGSADFVAKSFSVFASLFFGTCFIYTLKRIGAKNPVLLVNAKGITDNTSAMSLGFMPWEEIKEISLLKIQLPHPPTFLRVEEIGFLVFELNHLLLTNLFLLIHPSLPIPIPNNFLIYWLLMVKTVLTTCLNLL